MELPQRYSRDEMERILQRALSQHSAGGSVTREHLLEIAKELGLSEQEIQSAIEQELRGGEWEQAKEEWMEKRRYNWRTHLFWYLGINALLLGLNYAQEDGHFTWALWSVFGWGIGLLADTADTFFPNRKKVNKEVRKVLRRKERRRKRDKE